jgi:beta-phosphoglucomutase-like phosphatase (HAD superfamily)
LSRKSLIRKYNLALAKTGLKHQCLVIEDSRNGVLA